MYGTLSSCAHQQHVCSSLSTSGRPAAAAPGLQQRHVYQRQRWRQRAEPPNRDYIPPPPMPPPPPPPGQQQAGYGGFQQQQQQQQQQRQQYSSATPKFQELGWREIKDRYVRPTYLPLSFTLGALTIGLRLGAANYTFTDNPFEYLGTAVSTGVMFMALAWVLFDFDDEPPSGGGLSPPRR